ncbi:hypothetical protein BJ165DRAFT_1534638 [Panaeolus papilionaceus]|nr:hypothetical protein BJ165DRAFT_1534638 [Panaeolus papilionaceus]
MVLTPHVTRASTLDAAFQGHLLGLAVADAAGNVVAPQPSGDVDTPTLWLLSQGGLLALGVAHAAGIVIVGRRQSVVWGLGYREGGAISRTLSRV